MEVVDLEFPAMGGLARVAVVGGPARVAQRARARVAQLEGRWSRFLPDSEISQCNAASGQPVVVSAETFLLIEHACSGWYRTGGAYDPTVFDAMTRIGYTETFATMRERGAHAPSEPPSPSPGCGHVILDPVVRAVPFPRGVHYDPGGIGKGLAADIVATEALANGARGVLVSIGGDLRVEGEPLAGDAYWRIVVEDPDDPSVAIAALHLSAGGIATTSRCSRVWYSGDTLVHHVIDPRRGVPANGPRSVTVATTEAWLAEVYAKAAFVAGDGAAALLRDESLSGVVVGDGHVEVTA
jgi:thiamine biosynthesis lipoprotein